MACVVAVLAMFIGNTYFSAKLASATGIGISPRFSEVRSSQPYV